MIADADWSHAVRRAFGDRVRQARQQQSVSQEELALRCGLDRSYIGQVERGERNLSLENIYRIAEGLNLPASELVGPINKELELKLQGDK